MASDTFIDCRASGPPLPMRLGAGPGNGRKSSGRWQRLMLVGHLNRRCRCSPRFGLSRRQVVCPNSAVPGKCLALWTDLARSRFRRREKAKGRSGGISLTASIREFACKKRS